MTELFDILLPMENGPVPPGPKEKTCLIKGNKHTKNNQENKQRMNIQPQTYLPQAVWCSELLLCCRLHDAVATGAQQLPGQSTAGALLTQKYGSENDSKCLHRLLTATR